MVVLPIEFGEVRMEKASFPEQWLQVFAKFSLDFFVVELGSRNKVLYCGGEASSYFGYPSEVFVGLLEDSFANLVLEVDKYRVVKAIHETKESKTDMDLQFHLVRFDGSVSLVRIAGSYIYSKEGVPIYLFLLSDEKRDIIAHDTNLELFRLTFSVGSGSLVEANVQGRMAFLLHEFTSVYEALSKFVALYVHPQDRKAFAVLTDQKALASLSLEHKEISFRRTSHNEMFSGYRWSILSYSIESGGEGSSGLCSLVIQDSDSAASNLAEKTLQTQLDPLTGALNRLSLEAQVTQQIALCSANDSIGAFFMLDIDYFKWVNDAFGHDRGDQVLRQVTAAVKGVFRPTDIIARPGGDEFAVFITGIPSAELAMTKAESICRALRTIGKAEEDFALTCSVGVSLFPEHGTTFTELYHTSDLALYQAKREGKDRYCLYGVQSVHNGKEKPIDREWLFSQLEEDIYLCNVDTFELLFANDALLKKLGLTSLTAKGFCYEVLYGLQAPCKDCKNLFLKKSQVSTCIHKDLASNTMVLLQEKGLLLKGVRVKLAVSTPFPPEWEDFLQEHFSLDTPESLPLG
jgi:diguanylate cyclase (GGDEF)-like protein